MRRSALKRVAFLKRSSRVNAISKKRAAQLDERRATRETVLRRDERCVFADVDDAGRCFGPLTFGHIRKASQGGEYSEANGSAQCAHHNELIESDADFARLARRLGYLKLRGDD